MLLITWIFLAKKKILSQVAPKEKEYLNASAANHLNTLAKKKSSAR
jgi:hypothetical protein